MCVCARVSIFINCIHKCLHSKRLIKIIIQTLWLFIVKMYKIIFETPMTAYTISSLLWGSHWEFKMLEMEDAVERKKNKLNSSQ